MCSNLRLEDHHDERNVLSHFKGLTVSTLQYKYRTTSKYSLVKILTIKCYHYYTLEIDLIIGVGAASSLSKRFYCIIVLQKEIIIVFKQLVSPDRKLSQYINLSSIRIRSRKDIPL
jgi:hypothetical protein